MTEPRPDLWSTRDLPVLREIVTAIDNTGETVGSWEIASTIGVDVKDVERSMAALHRGG